MKTTFSANLRQRYKNGFVPVIPDIKIRSPKEGDLLRERDPQQVANDLEKAGAPALSVVTENRNFGGSLELLATIVRSTNLPVLRKDFISNPAEIALTANAGASAVLLICSGISQELLTRLFYEAIEQGLEPLIETHSKEEMEFAASLKAGLIGINNRDISQLEKDNGNVNTTADLAGYKPADCLLISESAIATQNDVRTAIKAGAEAVLVGTALLQAQDISSLYRKLNSSFPILKICGLQRSEDVHVCVHSGVDILGFVTEYPISVPWNLTRDQASQLISGMPGKSRSVRSCLVTGGRPEKIIGLAEQIKPDLVQLHFQETMADTINITQKLKQMGIGVIKTIPREDPDRIAQFGTSDLAKIMDMVNQSPVYALLADTRNPHNASSSSLQADWKFCQNVVHLSQKPVLIAGGIKPGNIISARDTTSAAGIDIMSGVEYAPGIKNAQLIQQASQAAHADIIC